MVEQTIPNLGQKRCNRLFFLNRKDILGQKLFREKAKSPNSTYE